MKLLVQDVQIKTVSVEVKAITLNGKQMTLSVFKQLEELEPTLDTDVIWGRVNYHSNCLDSEHIHVVWQRGKNIFKHTFYKPCVVRFSFTPSVIGDVLAFRKSEQFNYFRDNRFSLRLNRFACADFDYNAFWNYEWDTKKLNLDKLIKHWVVSGECSQEDIRTLFDEDICDLEFKLKSAVNEKTHDEIKKKETKFLLWDELNKLQQLFISV